MRHRTVALAFLVLAAAACAAVEHRDPSSVEQLERARFAAMVARDIDALAPMLAEDLRYVHSNATIEDKAQFLETIRTQKIRYDSIDVRDLKVRVEGTMALITGLLHLRGAIGGKPADMDLLFTDAYVLRDGRWQLVAWQSTRVP